MFRNIETYVKIFLSGATVKAEAMEILKPLKRTKNVMPLAEKHGKAAQPSHGLEDRVYRMHAEICSTLANSKRLKIINTLREKELSAGEVLSILNVPKANLSQHMAILQHKGVVVARRAGHTVYYRLARPKILKAFDLMRQLLFEILEEQQTLLKEYGKRKK